MDAVSLRELSKSLSKLFTWFSEMVRITEPSILNLNLSSTFIFLSTIHLDLAGEKHIGQILQLFKFLNPAAAWD